MKRTSATLGLLIVVAAGGAAAQQVTRLPEQDANLALRFEAVYQVGKEDGLDHEVFSMVPAVAFDQASNLYVLDRDNARVLVFGPDGKYLRAIGKPGEGPGELRIPTGVAVTSDGRVAVYDMANRAFSVFDRNGGYQNLIRLTQQAGMQAEVRAQGDAVLLTGSQITAAPGSLPTVSDSLPILVQSLAEGSASRVLFRAPSAPPVLNTSGTANRREIRMEPPPVFSPRVSWAPLPDGGIAVASAADWRVEVTGPDGRVRRVFERPIRARQVSERDRQAARERQRDQLASGAGAVRVENNNGRERMSVGRGAALPEAEIERILGNMRFASAMPVITGVAADRQGRLWVQREGGPGADPDTGPIDLLNADGRYLGTVRGERLPDAFGPDGLAAWIDADEMGVQRVTVRRFSIR